MARMVMVRSAVMTGLAFTVGLLVGLCFHLPGLASLDGSVGGLRGQEETGLLPLSRRARDAPGAGAERRLRPVSRRIQSTRNHTGGAETRVLVGDDSSRVGVKGQPSSWVGQHKLWLQEKVKAIEATYASIAEEKRRTVLRLGNNNKGDQNDIVPKDRPSNQANNQRPHNNPQQSSHSQASLPLHNADSGSLPQQKHHSQVSDRDQSVKGDPQSAGPSGERGSLKPDDSPVPEPLGSRTVSVLVSGGRRKGHPGGGQLSLQETNPSLEDNPPGVFGPGLQQGDHSSRNIQSSGGATKRRRQQKQRPAGDVTKGESRLPFKTLSDLVTGGIYWSQQVELMVPPGFNDDEISSWRNTLEKLRVVRMEEGCGRMQNRRLTLEDGHRACARYRVNTDQMQGEVFSYYLARLLGIRNLAPVVLSAADPSNDPRWASVDVATSRAQWSREKPVVLTPWMEGLQPAYIPMELRNPGKRDSTGNIDVLNNLHPSTHLLRNHTSEQLAELVQWSDLIVLDFLTANVDRVVNNLFNLQWNTEMMTSPAHNLESRAKDGLLVFLDNESGLFHSYRLLEKYAHYHDRLLGALCIFRPGTAKALKKLHKDNNAGEQLMSFYQQEEPRHWLLPLMPEANQKILSERIQKVINQINRCESRYSNKDFS